MQALVTLLPDDLYKKVQRIWMELKRDYNISRVLVTPFPHISLSTADSYKDIDKHLEQFISKVEPFTIRTNGLGIFAGERPLLYIEVNKNRELLNFHEELWKTVDKIAINPEKLYRPEYWVPHITLIFLGDLTKENIGEIMEKYAFQDFHYEFEVNNISLLQGSFEKGIKLVNTYNLKK
jgi:2'-5' RNA ligase